MPLIQNPFSRTFKTAHICMFVRLEDKSFVRWSYEAKSHPRLGRVDSNWEKSPFHAFSGLLVHQGICFFIHFLTEWSKPTLAWSSCPRGDLPLLLSLERIGGLWFAPFSHFSTRGSVSWKCCASKYIWIPIHLPLAISQWL